MADSKIPITELVGQCVAEIPGAMDSTIQRFAEQALRTFAQESKAWRSAHRNVPVQANKVGELFVEIPCPIESGEFDDEATYWKEGEFDVFAIIEIQRDSENGADNRGVPIHLQPRPIEGRRYAVRTGGLSVGDKLRIEVAYEMNQVGHIEHIPSSFNRWMGDIRAGVLGQMMLMPNQDWTNPDAGAIYRQQFADALVRSRRYGAGEQNHAPTRVKYGGL
ncbi:hypothetical protein ACPV5S_15705 [Vibrio astriarenae]